jgi:hypothetical protein
MASRHALIFGLHVHADRCHVTVELSRFGGQTHLLPASPNAAGGGGGGRSGGGGGGGGGRGGGGGGGR